MTQHIFAVSEVVRLIKSTLESNSQLQQVSMVGELSNVTISSNGHWYFTLKDAKARLACVMFASASKRIKTPIKEGDQVIVLGKISLYEASGSVQCYVSDIQLAGLGDLYAQLEKTRKQLALEGLFEANRKQVIPTYPMSIVLITSSQTAAYHDVMSTISRRWPVAKTIHVHTGVQGHEATAQIIDALKKADTLEADVVLLVRGGGSIEDLWCFNEEAVVRTIASMKTPIISGIGHESDITLVDYVVDQRAPTPTGAAELATPAIGDVQFALSKAHDQLNAFMDVVITRAVNQLDKVKHHRYFVDPSSLTQSYQQELKLYRNKIEHALMLKTRDLDKVEQYKTQLTRAITQLLQQQNERLNHYKQHHQSLSVESALKRGFSITMLSNQIIHSLTQIEPHQTVETQLADGTFSSIVTDKKEKHHE
jgi:exodeoxyribonuclease VII large subunit